MRALPAALLPAAATLWVIILCAAPLSLTRGSTPMATLAVYRGASVICHQDADRSLRVAGAQMPVCARCFGLYAAGAVGAVAAFLYRRRREPDSGRLIRIALVVAALPMVLSVGLEWAGLIDGSNSSRLASAVPLGAAAGWVLQRVVALSGTAAPSFG